jgi:CBS domain-containing protein
MGAKILDPGSAIGGLVTRDAVRVDPSSTLADVAAVMREANVSAVLVGARTGIVTERDLARGLAEGRGPADEIAVVASPHPVSVPERMPILDAAGLMLNEEVRHLVVELDDGREAVVSLRDVMAVLLQATSPHLWLTSLRLSVGAPAELWLG